MIILELFVIVKSLGVIIGSWYEPYIILPDGIYHDWYNFSSNWRNHYNLLKKVDEIPFIDKVM